MPALIDVLKNLLVKMSADQTVHIKKNAEAFPLKKLLENAGDFAGILTSVRNEDIELFHGIMSLHKSFHWKSQPST